MRNRVAGVVAVLVLAVLGVVGPAVAVSDAGSAQAYHLCGWVPGGCWNHPR